jgi:hypothetical protein
MDKWSLSGWRVVNEGADDEEEGFHVVVVVDTE